MKHSLRASRFSFFFLDGSGGGGVFFFVLREGQSSVKEWNGGIERQVAALGDVLVSRASSRVFICRPSCLAISRAHHTQQRAGAFSLLFGWRMKSVHAQ